MNKDEKILVEVQYDGALDYFHRMLYGASKLAIEYLDEGMLYNQIKKIYSVHIVYFELGQGDDYIYRGTTRFVGLHNEQELQLSTSQKKTFLKTHPADLFPEYYLLRINHFNAQAENPLDEWIQFFKSDFIKEDTQVQGLKVAREKMLYSLLSKSERAQYDRYIDQKRLRYSQFETKYIEGFDDGEKKGMQKGMKKGREEGIDIGMEKGMAIGMQKGAKEQAKQNARSMLNEGLPVNIVVKCTFLTLAEVEEMLREME